MSPSQPAERFLAARSTLGFRVGVRKHRINAREQGDASGRDPRIVLLLAVNCDGPERATLDYARCRRRRRE